MNYELKEKNISLNEQLTKTFQNVISCEKQGWESLGWLLVDWKCNMTEIRAWYGKREIRKKIGVA